MLCKVCVFRSVSKLEDNFEWFPRSGGLRSLNFHWTCSTCSLFITELVIELNSITKFSLFLKVLIEFWIEVLEDKTCKGNCLDLIVLTIMLHIQVQPKKVDQLIKQKVKLCLLRGFTSL